METLNNPYTYGNPMSDPKRFVGRKREIEQVFSRLRNPEFESSSIVGERRSGKTSLLNYIAHPDIISTNGLDPTKYLFVYLDLEMIVSNQQKWDTLGAERSGVGWRSGELPEGPVVASSPFGGLSLHLLPAL